MKNPTWVIDELLIVLELYLKKGWLDRDNQNIIEVSDLLNRLPIHKRTSRDEKFRNENGISMKLGNFMRLDPNYEGKGLERGNKLEKVVWEQYHNNLSELSSIVDSIKRTVNDEELLTKISTMDLDEDFESKEGKTTIRILHKYRERDPILRRKKLQNTLKTKGTLDCEICEFNFKDKYGELGDGFIECHHIVPLSSLKPDSVIKLDDLILLCSNCHRMVHRKKDLIPLDTLRDLINNSK